MPEPALYEVDGLLRADPGAGSTGDAERLAMNDFYRGGSTLRIVAPCTSKGAALEEDGRTDPRTILYGIAHDVEDLSLRFGSVRVVSGNPSGERSA